MPDSLQCDKCHCINESKTKSTGSLIANQILYQSNDLHTISCSPPVMHICTYVHAWCVDVGERAGEFSLLFPGSNNILHASVSTPSVCFPALQLFSSYFLLLLYQRGKKREAEILTSPYCHLPEIIQRCCVYRNQ